MRGIKDGDAETARRKDMAEVRTIDGAAGVAARSKVSRANVVLIAIGTRPKQQATSDK